MSNYVCVFDTETTGKQKSFCYNVGYIILNILTGEVVFRADRVVEQIWHNLPLFSTAYYAEKRPIYVKAMRARKTKMDKFGYICSEMRRVFKQYDIEYAYAYNSSFDEGIFDYNCDWFKCINPFDDVKIIDIRTLAINHIVDDEYKAFCDKHQIYTDSGNYSTTAEAMYQYIIDEPSFAEAHTALADSEIEAQILLRALHNGAEVGATETAPNSIERKVLEHWEVKQGHITLYEFDAHKIVCNRTNNKIRVY